MRFMGTGAAQLVPSPFCECEYCRKIRKLGDQRNVRGRSGFQLDDETLIDLGPDTQYTSALFGVSFRHTKNIFYTHFHTDHFSYANWENFHMCSEPMTLNIWCSEGALEGLENLGKLLNIDPSYEIKFNTDFLREHVTFHPMKLYETVQVGEMKVTPLRANHPGQFKEEKYGLNYIFEKNGKRLLYACDTGLWCEENYEYVKEKYLDFIIMDCTYGLLERDRSCGHLNLEHFEEIIRHLEKDGAYNKDTILYANHIGHECQMTYTEFENKMQEKFGRNAHVSYDGLEI